MKKTGLMLIAVTLLVVACKDKSTSGENSKTTVEDKAESGDEYFTYTAEGKNFSVAPEDISTSYRNTDSSFRIFAGKDQETSLTLTIPNIFQCPCSVASGSLVPGDDLSQGSVSFQHYPAKGYTFNNYYIGEDVRSQPVADAIKITSVGSEKDGYRYITGEINTTVLKSRNESTDPADKDYKITGKFRIRHDTHGTKDF